MRDSEHSVSAPAMTSLVPRGYAVDTTITQRSRAAKPGGGLDHMELEVLTRLGPIVCLPSSWEGRCRLEGDHGTMRRAR
jgi:hypothetical protein